MSFEQGFAWNYVLACPVDFFSEFYQFFMTLIVSINEFLCCLKPVILLCLLLKLTFDFFIQVHVLLQ